MGFQPLPKWNNLIHLPCPKGPYAVGITDLRTKENCLVRCYYPTKALQSSNDYYENSANWQKWLPSLNYADGYLRFKLSRGIPLLARFFRFLLGDPLCPTAGQTVMKMDQPLPVVIFSHGLGAMRSTYSILLSELASNGHFVAAVEHKDGSASATENVDGTCTFERKIGPDEDEYTVRNSQVNTRVKECEIAYSLLCQLSGQSNGHHDLVPDESSADFLSSLSQARLNLTDDCYISGHSFGGATALKCLYVSKQGNGRGMFKKALLYDTWMFPLRHEASNLANPVQSANALFVNCQRFQGMKNIESMRHFEISDNLITLKDALHYAPCDIPTVLMGSSLRRAFNMLINMEPRVEGGVPAYEALDICNSIGIHFLKGDLRPYLDSIDFYVIRGTSYMGKTNN